MGSMLGIFRSSKIGPASNKGAKEDPDEKWSNLYRERQRNHLYKWVDSKGGGQLIEIYDKEGEDGVHRFANEMLPPCLHNDGIMPEHLSQDEYVKWRKFMHTNLTGGDEINQWEILDSIGGQYINHTALWKLTKRGIDGETLIHLLLAKDQPKCTDIAKIMLKIFPGLASDIYEGEEFYGQSPLHLSIVHDDYEFVQYLIEAGADVRQRATGRFFLPEDQKTVPKAKFTNYYGFAYYGEYPLAFAASFGNKDIYDFLIQHGADPNWQDSFGNTVLHMCVINNSIDMYSYSVRHWAKPADDNISNNAGYTPLTLATILGRREIFEAMLELTKMEFWRFSDMTYSAYPLTTLDTIRYDGSTNWESALMRVVNGTTSDHLDMVGCEVIQRLLADKWRLFGERKMYERFAFHLFHVFCLTLAIYTRPTEASDLSKINTPMDFVRYVAETATLISSLIYFLYQQSSEIRAQGFHSYLRSLRQAPEKPISFASNLFILLIVPCRFLHQYSLEEYCLVLALPGFWISLLFFAKGFLMTGPFVVMIYSMVAGDMVRFGIISLIFLVSFSQGFYFLAKDIKDKQILDSCPYHYEDIIEDYDEYFETALTLIRMSMGGYDYEKLYCASYPTLMKILFVLFMIIMPIMLINMLIAMMGNTYERVISHAEKAWRQQWAQIVILLERSLDKKKLAKLQLEYSIRLNDDRFDDNEGDTTQDIRGIMVIKQTKQTRAKQRKQATASWKRLGRKILSLLRGQGVEKTRKSLHRGQVVVDSRPPSAAPPVFPMARRMSHTRRSSVFALGQDLDDPQIAMNHVVNTMRRTTMTAPPPPVGLESPKLQVHHHPLAVATTHGESLTSTSMEKSMINRKLSALEKPYIQERFKIPASISIAPGSTVVIDEYPGMPLSSPNSLSGTAIDNVLNGPDDSDRSKSRSSIQLQPLTLEQLPSKSRRPERRRSSNARTIETSSSVFKRRNMDRITVTDMTSGDPNDQTAQNWEEDKSVDTAISKI